jgi:hypothetical protein
MLCGQRQCLANLWLRALTLAQHLAQVQISACWMAIHTNLSSYLSHEKVIRMIKAIYWAIYLVFWKNAIAYSNWKAKVKDACTLFSFEGKFVLLFYVTGKNMLIKQSVLRIANVSEKVQWNSFFVFLLPIPLYRWLQRQEILMRRIASNIMLGGRIAEQEFYH